MPQDQAAPAGEVAAEVLEASRVEGSAPKSFDSLRGGPGSVFEPTEEELEAAEGDPAEPTEPEGEIEEPAPEEVPEKVESGKEKPKPETPSKTGKKEGEEEVEEEAPPTDTQSEDGYVAEVQLIVDGKAEKVPIEKLYETAEFDLFTPKGTTTVKGLEAVRELAQKGLYSDERNAKANQMMEQAKTLSASFQQEVVKQAQVVAARYLQDYMERTFAGQPQDPNNPLSQAPQDPQGQPSSIRDQYLVAQLNAMRTQLETFKAQQEQERLQQQTQISERQRMETGNAIAQTAIMPFQKYFKNGDGSLDEGAFVSFADVAANRTVFRVQQINSERKAQDPEYPGMSAEEVGIITAQVAREVYQADQARITRLMDQKLKAMKKPVRVGALKGGGADIVEDKPNKGNKAGPKTFDSLRQPRPASR